jgi:hypothetical protein
VLNQPLFSFFSSLLLVTVSTPRELFNFSRIFPSYALAHGEPSIRTADIPNCGSTTPRSAVYIVPWGRVMLLEYSGTLYIN